MALLYRRCAGLDIHRDTVVACVRTRAKGKFEEQRETFGTFTNELKRMERWLRAQRVRQVAMESTGVYWMPVWNVLEASRCRFQLTLVNPAQVRAMAGHKTDQIDSGRIAEFLQHGRLAGSFIPPVSIREARAVERRRVHLQQDRNRVIHRIGRLLQTVNIKLSSVLSNIVGLSGRRILRAIADGRRNGEKLAALAHHSLNGKKAQIAASLEGRYSEHFRWLLAELPDELDRLDDKLAEVTRRLEDYMTPHAELIERLTTIPGIEKITAWTLIAETGADMSPFPDAKHLASWAGLCPGNNESAGKRKSGRTRKGNRYLRRILVQAAWAAAHTKDTYLSALFLRLARKIGMKKATVALAHRMLLIAFHIIRDGERYREAGGDYFDKRNPARTARRLMARLEALGYDISLNAPDATAPPQPARRRQGRPCKCVERGVACAHLGLPAPAPEPVAPTIEPVPQAPRCKKCAAWKIDCIHVRPKLRP
ncbi:MAG: IS110 family transposase [Acidobacteriota bacterium]|nr:IS110 family transposase [Acidobacteriota bacterium]